MGNNSKVHQQVKGQTVVCLYSGILLSNETEPVIHVRTEMKIKTIQLSERSQTKSQAHTV